MRIPEHLPSRLTISLWDFSWLTLAGPGEVYEDLETALDQTAARGYTTVRICAAPLLLFGELGLDDLAESLPVEGLGPSPAGSYFGRRTRWYAVPGGFETPARQRFFALLEGLRRRNMSVILSSWEYQQTTAFAADPRWHRAIDAIPRDERPQILARAFGRLLDAVHDAGLDEVVALVELHNEVDFSRLPSDRDVISRAVASLQATHPRPLVTVSLGQPPHLAMYAVPDGLGAGQFHVYAYGVLDALQQRIDIRATGTGAFPGPALQGLQLPDSPTFADYGRPSAWKLDATVVTDQMLYGYDTIDADRWDTWLYENYGRYHELMHREISSRVVAAARWGHWQDVPVLVGEGWVGYTPLEGTFEEGPIGRALAGRGIRTAAENGVWGIVPSSNCAPHHPMWQDAHWQIEINEEFRSA